MAKSEDPITIKKYANRRLYNTGTSTYVTLEDLATMVKQGENFVVYDAKTGEDLTRSILTQIIMEEDGKGRNLLPINFLRHLIRFYDDSLRAFLPRYLEMSILDGEFDKEALKEISPYFFADQVQIPVLLMHGEDDKVVEFEQSRMMHRALSKAGKSAQLIRLNNEDHYLQEGSTRLQALQAMIAFVDKHIGNDGAAR